MLKHGASVRRLKMLTTKKSNPSPNVDLVGISPAYFVINIDVAEKRFLSQRTLSESFFRSFVSFLKQNFQITNNQTRNLVNDSKGHLNVYPI